MTSDAKAEAARDLLRIPLGTEIQLGPYRFRRSMGPVSYTHLVRVLELSPLREWVKLQRNATGQKVWHRLEDVKWIEQLFPVAPGGEPKPPHAV